MKIGEVGSHWDKHVPIDYATAKIKMGDVFDYYTTRDGTLMVPNWSCFKFAVDEFLENAPQFKYHPSRVREFVEENGMDQLEHME